MGEVSYCFPLRNINIYYYLGFAFVFSIMEPVPRVAKIMFHIYGLGSLILGIISAVFTFQANECVSQWTVFKQYDTAAH